MFAVAAYSIPESTNDHVGGWASAIGIDSTAASNGLSTLRWKVAGPYLLSTSQWQQWNMFSPEPIRQVLQMQIEKKTGDTWTIIRELTPKSTPWWSYSREVKILYTIGMDDRYKPARQAFLASECTNLEPRAHLRMVYLRYVVPVEDIVHPESFWKTYTPEVSREIDSEFTCPATT